MLGFIIGAFIGAIFGFFLCALFCVSGDDNDTKPND